MHTVITLCVVFALLAICTIFTLMARDIRKGHYGSPNPHIGGIKQGGATGFDSLVK